jgi:hypothetical protein
MRPEELAAASTASTPVEATVKPKGKKPPAAPPGPTTPASTAASGSTGGGSPAPAASGEDVLRLKKTGDVNQILGTVSNDLGMFAGALTTVPEVDTSLGITPELDPELAGLLGRPMGPKVSRSLKPSEPLDKGLPEWKGTTVNTGMALQPQGLPAISLGHGVNAHGSASALGQVPLQQHIDIPSQSDTERAERKAALPGRGHLKDVKPMSWDEYEALPEAQRAAVDFNTLLTNAVRRDRKLQDTYDPNPLQQETYRSAVIDMFGTDGNSKMFAPETMEVLQQLEIKDTAADLDDFLKLKVVITADDLKKIDVASPFDHQGSSLETVQENLAGNTRALGKELAEGGIMLNTIGLSARTARNADPLFDKFGAINKPTIGKVTAGFGLGDDDPTGDVDAQFQMFYRDIASSGKDAEKKRNEILSKMDPAYVAKFKMYEDNYSLQAQRYGLEAEGWLSPEEYRRRLGLAPKDTRKPEKPEPVKVSKGPVKLTEANPYGY